MKKLRERILNSTIVRKGELFLSKVSVNKKYDIDLKTVLSLFITNLNKNSISSQAKAVTFNFTLAVFPAIIFLFTLLPYIPIENFKDQMMDFIHTSIPNETMQATVSDTIEGIFYNQQRGLMTFGFAMALFLSTNGMMGLMGAFNKSYRTREKRSFIKKRLIAMTLTVLLTFVMFACILVFVFGKKFIDSMKAEDYFDDTWHSVLMSFFQFSVFFILFLFAFSCIYYFAPSVQKRFKFFSIGSIMATIMAVSVSAAFSYYINNFPGYNAVYGSIGTLIAFMIWLNVISMVILVGFEINASIDAIKRKSLRDELVK